MSVCWLVHLVIKDYKASHSAFTGAISGSEATLGTVWGGRNAKRGVMKRL